MAEYILDQALLDVTTTTDYGAYWLGLDNANASTGFRMALRDMLTGYSQETRTGHGRVSGDVGKPIDGEGVIVDDAAADAYVSGVLAGVPDVNTLVVAPVGSPVFDIAIGLLDGGDTYDISTDGRFVYWDLSAGVYKATLPADSKIGAVLQLIDPSISSGATTFNARVVV